MTVPVSETSFPSQGYCKGAAERAETAAAKRSENTVGSVGRRRTPDRLIHSHLSSVGEWLLGWLAANARRTIALTPAFGDWVAWHSVITFVSTKKQTVVLRVGTVT